MQAMKTSALLEMCAVKLGQIQACSVQLAPLQVLRGCLACASSISKVATAGTLKLAQSSSRGAFRARGIKTYRKYRLKKIPWVISTKALNSGPGCFSSRNVSRCCTSHRSLSALPHACHPLPDASPHYKTTE